MHAVLFVSLYFEIFLLITFLEHLGVEHSAPASPDDATLPRVAVIVPCFNEEATVGRTIESLLALTYPKDKLEIIAVNDGSTDATLQTLSAFAQYPSVHIIDKKNGGKHSAMNAALAHTTADLIGCLDADSYVDADALLYLVPHFVANEQVAAITPSIKVAGARSLLQVVQKAEYGLSIFIRKTFALADAVFITPGPFSFFRRSVIEEVGPWKHAHSTEDLEMGLRLQRFHKRIVNEPRARVYTKTPESFAQLVRQRVRWTYGFLKNAVDYRFMFLNPHYGTLGLLVLPITLFSLLGAIFLFMSVLWNVLVLIAQELTRMQTVGVSLPHADIELFYISTDVVLSMTIVVVALTVVLMGIGKRLAQDPSFSADIPVYIALYGFIAPLWLTAALYKAVASSGVRWR